MAKDFVLGSVENAEVTRVVVDMNVEDMGTNEFVTSARISFVLIANGDEELHRETITKELVRGVAKATLSQAIGSLHTVIKPDVDSHYTNRTGKAVVAEL
jgi:hypothetical protein